MHNVEPPSGYFELCARPSVRLSCDDGYYVVTAFPQVFPSEDGRASLCGATESGQENQKERGGNELTSPSLLCAYCIVCTYTKLYNGINTYRRRADWSSSPLLLLL